MTTITITAAILMEVQGIREVFRNSLQDTEGSLLGVKDMELRRSKKVTSTMEFRIVLEEFLEFKKLYKSSSTPTN